MTVDQLPPKYKTLYRLRYQEQPSYDQQGIQSGFIWRETPEGIDFWSNVLKAGSPSDLPDISRESNKDIKNFEINRIKQYVLGHYNIRLRLIKRGDIFYPKLIDMGVSKKCHHLMGTSKIEVIRKTLIEIVRNYGQEN